MNENGPINLVFALDRNFIQHCGVCLSSLFDNNKDCQFHIHLIYDDPADPNLKVLQNFIETHRCSVFVHFFDKSLTDNFKISHHITSATYYRLFIPDLIQNLDKIIYLDCDMIVVGSIRELWNIDLGSSVIGVVQGEDQDYFNAGLLLIDINKWRQLSITEKCIEWINGNNSNIRFWDQDALNAILGRQASLLSEVWNFMQTDCTKDDLLTRDIRIVHFVGGHKPWNFYCVHPLKYLYFKYIIITPWKNFRIYEETWRYRIKFLVKKFLRGINLLQN